MGQTFRIYLCVCKHPPPPSAHASARELLTLAATRPLSHIFRSSNLAPPLDVDMFVSDWTSPSPPSSTSYKWASTNSFAEILDITPGAGAPNPCNYTIAVSPFTPGKNVPYSISIMLPNTTLPLTPGVPTDGLTPAGGTTYFNISFPVPTNTLTAVVEAVVFSGDLQVFVTAASGAAAPPTPSLATAAFTLNAYPGVNDLPLAFADPRVSGLCPVGAPCNLAFGAFSPTGATFSLAVDTSNALATLTDGVPLTRSAAANGTAFFAYTPLSAATVNFTLTVFSGAPSLYVTAAAAPAAPPALPGPGPAGSGVWTWSAVQGPAGGASVLFVSISPSDPAWPPAGPPPGPFYIGVGAGAAAAGPSTFSISAVTAAGGYSPFLLEDGVPQGASVPPHAMSYFLLDLAHSEGSAGGLDAWATPSQGAVAVYVSAGAARSSPLVFPTPLCRAADPHTGVCLGWTAAPGTFNWTSEGTSPPPGLVSLLPGTLQQPTPYLPVIVVAVLAASLDDPVTGAPPPPSLFAVTAASGGRPMQLQAGVGAPGAVAAGGQSGDTKRFAFFPSIAAADIAISVDVPTGRLEVYAAEFSAGAPSLRPGPGSSQWNSTGQNTRAMRSRVVYIPWTSLSQGCRFAVAANPGFCGIAIAVVGGPMMPPMRAAFTITAAASGSPAAPIALPNGGFESVLLQPLGCAYLLSRAPLGAFLSAAFITVSNVVGSTTLRVNVGDSRGGFWRPVNPNPFDPTGNAADYTAPDEGGFERVIARVNASSSVYSTVCADARGAEAVVGYHLAGAIVPLEGGVPAYGASLPGGTAYYSFAVADPSATLTITVARLDTAMNVFIAVENPLQPWALPSAASYTWTLYPTPLGPSISIAPGSPGACVPSPAAPPCTYYIAVQPIEGNDATWLITAAADAQVIPSLLDGQPTGGSVQGGVPNYYAYQPAIAGFPAPAVLFSWSNLFGAVVLYVTNRFVPGASPPSDLPGPASTTSCQWVCTNFTACAVAPGDPCYAPSFPPGSGSPVMYTVAVVGATGYLGATSTYTLTATNAGDAQQLQVGTPTTDIILFAQTPATFVLDLGLGAARNDVAITATVNHGDVVMLVAPLRERGGGPPRGPPGCAPFSPGARLYCANYTWLATSGVGDSVLYLPAAAPCAPVAPPGTPPPQVDPSCAAAFPGALMPGRYLITIFPLAFSELSLLAQDYARPVPKVLLADGQPQLLQSGPLTVCPGVARDAATGACPAGAPALSTLGSLAVFYVPAGGAAPFVTVMLERLCGGNVTGECGTPLWVGVSACADGYTCANATAAPYGADAGFRVHSFDAVTTFTLPYEFCWNTTASGALPPGGVGCFYTVGVWPTAAGGAPGPGGPQPGVGVPPQTYRLTATTPLAVQRVAQDCPGAGRFCSLPELYMGLPGDSGAPPPPRVFETYLHKAPSAPLPATAVASLCYGASLSVYACVAGGSCARWSAPGPSNYDFSAAADTRGNAQLQLALSSDVYWLGVAAGGGGRSPPPAFAPAAPSFSLSLQHGPGLTLAVPPGGALTPAWSADGATLTVSWPLPTLAVPGVPGTVPTQGMFFVLHAYQVGSAADPAQDNQVQLSTPCGLEYVRRNVPLPAGQGVVQFAPQSQACGGGAACSISLSGLSTTISYRLALAAYCGPMADPRTGAPPCMPFNQEGQAVAFPWTSDVPVPTPLPSPSPSRAPPAPAAAPTSKPSAAGAVVGTLFALAAVGALGWFGVERFYPGGRAAFYQPLVDLLPSAGAGGGGGDGFYGQIQQAAGLRAERPSASAARGALGAHPLLAAPADDAGQGFAAPSGYVAPSIDSL